MAQFKFNPAFWGEQFSLKFKEITKVAFTDCAGWHNLSLDFKEIIVA